MSVLRYGIEQVINILELILFGILEAKTHFVHMWIIFPQLRY